MHLERVYVQNVQTGYASSEILPEKEKKKIIGIIISILVLLTINNSQEKEYLIIYSNKFIIWQ